MVDDIKQMKNVVEYIMIEHPRTRNSDTLLIFKVLSYLRFVKKLKEGYLVEYFEIDNIPAIAGIIRVRQKIQNDEERLRPTDDEVLKQRRMLKYEMDEIHDWYNDW